MEMPDILNNAAETTARIMRFELFQSGGTPITVSSICILLVLFAIVFIFERIFVQSVFLEQLLRRSSMDQPTRYTVRKVAGYTFLAVGYYISLLIVGINLTSLALIAGAIGVGLGFGLQNIISNFVSGIIILFERSLKVGDFVELASGVSGEVQEINMRSTLVTTNDNIDILVPNSEFVNGQVTNWTHRDALRRIHVPFGVAYGTDKELVKKAALEVAGLVSFTVQDDDQRRPQVWFVGFGNSSLDFELVVWVGPEAVNRPGAVQAAYLWELHTALYKYEIEIPFPQNDLHVRSFFGLKGPEATNWLEQRAGRASDSSPEEL